MKKILMMLLTIPAMLFAGVPQYELTVDTQYPSRQWEIKPIYQGATPLVRVNLNVNGTNWYPSSDWSGFLWYGTNTDWASTSIVRITGTFATNLYYVDCQATNGTFGSNGVFYGGFVMSNGTSQLIEWGRGKVYVTTSGGVGGVNSLSFTNGAYYDHINNTLVHGGLNTSNTLTNVVNVATTGETGQIGVTGRVAYVTFPAPTNAVTTWAEGKFVTSSITNNIASSLVSHQNLTAAAHGISSITNDVTSSYIATINSATGAVTVSYTADINSHTSLTETAHNIAGITNAVTVSYTADINTHTSKVGTAAHGLGTMATNSGTAYVQKAGDTMDAGAILNMNAGSVTNATDLCATNRILARYHDSRDASAGAQLRSFSGTTALTWGVGNSGAVTFGDGITLSGGSTVNGSGSSLTNMGMVHATNGSITNLQADIGSIRHLDVLAPSANLSSNPPSGYARLYGRTVNSQEALYLRQSDGGEYRIMRDSIHTVANENPYTLTNGQVVCWTTNMLNTAHYATLAKADSLTTLPAQGIVVGGNAASGSTATVMFYGRTPTNYLPASLRTYAYGTPLYVSPLVAGELTATEPQYPYYSQPIAYVNYDGAMDVRLTKPTRLDIQGVLQTYKFDTGGAQSTINTNNKIMKLLSGTFTDGTWTNQVTANDQYVLGFQSGPAGLTELKSGGYTVHGTISQTASGLDAVRLAAELYVCDGTVTNEIIAGTAQSIAGTPLEYIWTLNVTSNVTLTTNSSLMVRFKTSGVAGQPLNVFLSAGSLDVSIPSSQYVLNSDYAAFTNNTAYNFTNMTADIYYSGDRYWRNKSNTDTIGFLFDEPIDSYGLLLHGTNTASSTKGDVQIDLVNFIGEFVISRDGADKIWMDLSNNLNMGGNSITNTGNITVTNNIIAKSITNVTTFGSSSAGGVTNCTFSFVMLNSGTNYMQFISQTNANGACQTNLIPISTR